VQTRANLVCLRIFRYKNLSMASGTQYNYGFWGQMCGPAFDDTPSQAYKYPEDAISVNTSKQMLVLLP
jgi:hypothetical protein